VGTEARLEQAVRNTSRSSDVAEVHTRIVWKSMNEMDCLSVNGSHQACLMLGLGLYDAFSRAQLYLSITVNVPSVELLVVR